MVQKGVIWTMGEYPYFVIMYSYIISKDTALMDRISNGYGNHGVCWRVEKKEKRMGNMNVNKSIWNILRIVCLYVRRNLRRSEIWTIWS